MKRQTSTDCYARSRALLERAERVIPLGSQTFSKSRTQYPRDAAPLFLARGQGARVWDVDGNEYVDLVCGLLPVVLGYRDPDVDQAVRDQLANGITFSLATELETELAERLVDIIPCAEKVRFGKNGSDATAATVRLARAFTGRDRVAAGGYHGWQDWYIGATVRNKGVPNAVRELTHRFPYNDVEALHSLLNGRPGEFAAVIMEPVSLVEPEDGYLEEVRALAHGHGALLIFDEIITGFRVARGGAQEHYGVTPDLACFGKSLGNGMPISAVVGRAGVMAEMEEIFFSTTFGGETLSLAAAIAVIDKMRREPVIEALWDVGQKLAEAAKAKISEVDLDGVMVVGGLPPWTAVTFCDHPKARKEAIKTLFVREMLKNGVLVQSSHNVCYAHSAEDLTVVTEAYGRALGRIADELHSGLLEERLGCPVIRPVFSVREEDDRNSSEGRLHGLGSGRLVP
jgi:glutamate-1-semialdehyde 2,1-aminomutase/spore coat polysaccharide biosynthesis protein SpsF